MTISLHPVRHRTSLAIALALSLSANVVLARDPSFEVRLTRAGIVNEVVVQPDGKILATGEFEFIGGARLAWRD